LNGSTLQDWDDLLLTHSGTETNVHYGSRIAFDDNGYIYFSIGDRGIRENAQDLTLHAGSILRLKRDGNIPIDNPFVDTANALPEIWSYGHRNPQGLVWDNDNKRLWSIEHGPRGGDEINLIEKGKNYGWPIISYGKEYWGPVSVGEGTHKVGMEQPVKYYAPSIAPGSLLYYTGDAFPEWQGDLLAGALILRHLNRVELNEQGEAIAEERLLEDLNQRIRALVQSPEGWIYFSTDRGNIYVLTPNKLN
jgi:glucose/arabinose dehydrogenase